jgi:cyclopropane fatty-acyl-phospholipid synthase-like methyltransferase
MRATDILSYLPDFIIRFFIHIVITYNLYILKRYRGPCEENQPAVTAGATAADTLEIETGTPEMFYACHYGANMLSYGGKWSSSDTTTLTGAETSMLEQIESRLDLASLEDGSRILDLNCVWGTTIMYLANKYPKLLFTGVATKDIVATNDVANITILDSPETYKYSRIIAIDILYHTNNYTDILDTINSLLTDDGLLYLQSITHRENTIKLADTAILSRYVTEICCIPSVNKLYRYQEKLTIKNIFCSYGTHTARSVNHWLHNLSNNKAEILSSFFPTKPYMYEQWRLFYLIYSECLQCNNGREFVVSTYIMTKKLNNAAASHVDVSTSTE